MPAVCKAERTAVGTSQLSAQCSAVVDAFGPAQLQTQRTTQCETRCTALVGAIDAAVCRAEQPAFWSSECTAEWFTHDATDNKPYYGADLSPDGSALRQAQ